MCLRSHPLELLAPAGDLEKLDTALLYGADAVYAGINDLSLRATGMSVADAIDGIRRCHARQRKFYLTLNLFAFNADLKPIQDALEALQEEPPDGIVVSDPGVATLVQELLPAIPLHLSTQANTTHWRSAKFWHDQGFRRIVLARELRLPDIADIHSHVPDLEVELFVHGAMCMAFSGRCLMSHVLTGRSANQGRCAQPCRWEYALVETDAAGAKAAPSAFLEATPRGTALLNAKDLRLIEHLPAIAAAGVSSIKIEGRMKPAYYTALTTQCYREALDACDAGLSIDSLASCLSVLSAELETVSHRPFSTGFAMGADSSTLQYPEHSGYIKPYELVGMVTGWENGQLTISVRNRIAVGDTIEFLDPQQPIAMAGANGAWVRAPKQEHSVTALTRLPSGERIPAAHNSYTVKFPVAAPVSVGSIIRRKR